MVLWITLGVFGLAWFLMLVIRFIDWADPDGTRPVGETKAHARKRLIAMCFAPVFLPFVWLPRLIQAGAVLWVEEFGKVWLCKREKDD